MNIALRKIQKLYKYIISTSRWSLAYKLKEDANYIHIPQPSDMERADGFVAEHEGKVFVFFEEFKNREVLNGCLQVGELDVDNNTLINIKTILKKPYHLSYPHIFMHENIWYMIPESHQNNTVDLYQFTEFPYALKKTRTLLSDIPIVDSSILIQNNSVYLFTGIVNHNGANSNLSLFYSDDLLTGTFMPHPNNPIKTSSQYSRMAGSIFSENENSYRIAQNCEVRYGVKMHKFKITSLSNSEYSEELIQTMKLPKGCNASHTYNQSEHFEVIDVMKNHTSLMGILGNMVKLFGLLKNIKR